MKPKFFSRFIVAVAFVSLCMVDLSAAETKGRPSVNKKPDLRVDTSSVGDGKSGLVTSYADVIEPVQKAVVSIYSTKIVRERIRVDPFLRPFFPDQERESKQEGLGSGVIVSADGYIITNSHVIEGADELKVLLADDRELVGKVIGTDPKTDIAVVKIEAEKLPVVTLADSDKLRVGDIVFAVGNPLRIGQTVTMGIVSAKGRHVGLLEEQRGYEDYIQTDAAINMGNSGGALVDAKGRLVGINSAILSPSGTNIGIGFAVPVNLASAIMHSLIETGTVARGSLGVASAENVTPDIAEQLGLPKETKGVIIADLSPGEAAENAGLKRTDVILSINEHAITSLEELRLLIAQMAPGSVARLKIARDGKERTINVTLDRFDEKPNELIPGVNVRPLSAADRSRMRMDARVGGLLVTDVADDSPFHDDLVPGCVIMSVNKFEVSELVVARQRLQPGPNLLRVYYNGRATFVVVNLPEK